MLSVLGWRCRGGVTGAGTGLGKLGRGGTSFSLSDLEVVVGLNRLRTRLPVRVRRDLVDRPPTEFRAEGRRRKSVL